jgi:hypothetical protein
MPGQTHEQPIGLQQCDELAISSLEGPDQEIGSAAVKAVGSMVITEGGPRPDYRGGGGMGGG